METLAKVSFGKIRKLKNRQTYPRPFDLFLRCTKVLQSVSRISISSWKPSVISKTRIAKQGSQCHEIIRMAVSERLAEWRESVSEWEDTDRKKYETSLRQNAERHPFVLSPFHTFMMRSGNLIFKIFVKPILYFLFPVCTSFQHGQEYLMWLRTQDAHFICITSLFTFVSMRLEHFITFRFLCPSEISTLFPQNTPWK